MLSLALCAATLPVPLQDRPTPLTDALEPKLAELVVRLLEEHGEPGLALVLVEGGAPTLCRGFGVADRESGRAVDGDTLFNVGSISKSVTAWGAMRLVDADELALDAPVELERWKLPESEHDASGVTVRRLLQHTAGISQPSIGGYDLGEPLPSIEDELTRFVRLEHAPGTRHEYSGGGYTLLQLLVEETAEQPFAAAMRDGVLVPLGMTSSRFGYDPAIADKAATPYSTRAGDPQTGRWRHRAFVGVAGAALYTSARDLGRFLAAHCTGPDGEAPGRGVLEPDTLRAMAQTSELSPRYGLGYGVPPPAEGHVVLMHSGSNIGWRALYMVLPDLGIGIAALTNSDGHAAVDGAVKAFRDALLESLRPAGER